MTVTSRSDNVRQVECWLSHFVYGDARPQAINKRLFEHVISANNSCPQVIKMDVCYYGSQRCVPLSVPGYSRREVVLGVMPAIEDFRFEFKERFY
jgi:hypothetical protein